MLYSVFCYLLATLAIFLYIGMKKKFSYWKNQNVAGPAPVPVFGNILPLLLRKQSFGFLIRQLYEAYPEEPVVGIYVGRKPMIVIRDPELIKQVLIKDFVDFADRGLNISKSPLSENLFRAEGDTWRILRKKLTPIFTAGKLKNMFPLIQDCIEKMELYVEQLISNGTEPEIRNLMAKYTLESIGSCAFGIDIKAFDKDTNEAKEVAPLIFKPRLEESIGLAINLIFPGILLKLGISLELDRVVNFFLNLVDDIVEDRKGKPKVRKDLMDLMLELKEQGHVKGTNVDNTEEVDIEITNTIMAAQALVFFAAGFETSSGAMSFLLHELAVNPNMQEKLHLEIHEVLKKYDGKLTYESLHEMTYLEMLFSETLRKYSVVHVLFRVAVNDCILQNGIKLDKGVKVIIPVNALHHDPKYFPNPEKFDPERFSPTNRENIRSCVYLPFGDGPRSCIALRFGKVESMAGIAAFIQKFKVEPSRRTKATLDYNPKSLFLESELGIWVHISRR